MLRQRLHLLPAVRPMTALGVGRLLHQPFCFSVLHRGFAQRQKGLWPISSRHLGSSINGHSFWIGVATTASAAAIPETTILAGGGIWHTRDTFACLRSSLRLALHTSGSSGNTTQNIRSTSQCSYSDALNWYTFLLVFKFLLTANLHLLLFDRPPEVPLWGPGPSPRCDICLIN